VGAQAVGREPRATLRLGTAYGRRTESGPSRPRGSPIRLAPKRASRYGHARRGDEAGLRAALPVTDAWAQYPSPNAPFDPNDATRARYRENPSTTAACGGNDESGISMSVP